MAEQHVSPDGKWLWNGKEWVPNTPTGRATAKKRHPWRYGCGIPSTIAGLIVVIVIIVAIANSGSKSNTTSAPASSAPKASQPASKPAAPACTQPCAVAGAVTLSVSQIQYPADPGPYAPQQTGTAYIEMTVTAHNEGSSEYNFNATNFVIQDPGGVKHTFYPMPADQATLWSPVNLTKGATQAERISFQVPEGQQLSGFTLVWTPDFLSGDKAIKLG